MFACPGDVTKENILLLNTARCQMGQMRSAQINSTPITIDSGGYRHTMDCFPNSVGLHFAHSCLRFYKYVAVLATALEKCPEGHTQSDDSAYVWIGAGPAWGMRVEEETPGRHLRESCTYTGN